MVFLAIALVFVYRSFYSMRITNVSGKDEINYGGFDKKDMSIPELVEEASESYLAN